MSLILDALKKSEAERQRQSGPTLLEVRVTQPRRRYPTWVIAVGALLALNMLLLVVFMLHRPASPQAQVPQAGSSVMAPALAASTAAASAPPTPSSGIAASGIVAPMAASAPVLDAAAGVDSGIGSLPPVARIPQRQDSDGQDSAGNPADDVPAVSANRAAAGSSAERDGADHYASLPNFGDVGGDLPELRLDLHVYAEHPRDRYAMINMHRVREGDALPEGPRVLAITREGVALDYRGQEFMLRPQ